MIAVGKKLIVSFSILKFKKKNKLQKTDILFVLKDVFLFFLEKGNCLTFGAIMKNNTI